MLPILMERYTVTPHHRRSRTGLLWTNPSGRLSLDGYLLFHPSELPHPGRAFSKRTPSPHIRRDIQSKETLAVKHAFQARCPLLAIKLLVAIKRQARAANHGSTI